MEDDKMTTFGKEAQKTIELEKAKGKNGNSLRLKLEVNEPVIVVLHESTSTTTYLAHGFFDNDNPSRNFGPVACIKNRDESAEDCFDLASKALIEEAKPYWKTDKEDTIARPLHYDGKGLKARSRGQIGCYLIDGFTKEEKEKMKGKELQPEPRVLDLGGEPFDNLLKAVQSAAITTDKASKGQTNLFNDCAIKITKRGKPPKITFDVDVIYKEELSPEGGTRFDQVSGKPFEEMLYDQARFYVDEETQKDYLQNRVGFDLKKIGLEPLNTVKKEEPVSQGENLAEAAEIDSEMDTMFKNSKMFTDDGSQESDNEHASETHLGDEEVPEAM
jgi:hypothetical protein